MNTDCCRHRPMPRQQPTAAEQIARLEREKQELLNENRILKLQEEIRNLRAENRRLTENCN